MYESNPKFSKSLLRISTSSPGSLAGLAITTTITRANTTRYFILNVWFCALSGPSWLEFKITMMIMQLAYVSFIVELTNNDSFWYISGPYMQISHTSDLSTRAALERRRYWYCTWTETTKKTIHLKLKCRSNGQRHFVGPVGKSFDSFC